MTAARLLANHRRIEFLIMLLEFSAVALLVVDVEIITDMPDLPLIIPTTSRFLIAVAPVLITVTSVIKSSFSWGVKYIIMQAAAKKVGRFAKKSV